MPNNDLIKVVFTPEEVEAMKQGVQQMTTVIDPKAPVLSNDDRRNYGSVAEQNKLLINKSKSYMEQFPELKPGFVDKDEFDRDYAARQEIEKLIILLSDLQRKLSDMKILLDHDNYQDALMFYRAIRYSAREKVASAVTIYNDLKQHFPRGAAKPENVD